jgi:N-acetylglutamate synthase-like GNAT family acetyltransferase
LAVNVGIRAAEAGEKDELERMLRAAKLPFAGVAEGFPDCYVIARSSEGVVGAAGLQTYGAAGLLRSVVVHDSVRGQGLGRALVEERLAYARALGLDRIFLLTTSAEAYFKALGFEPAAREEAPANMQASAEFAGACPASAACLARRP